MKTSLNLKLILASTIAIFLCLTASCGESSPPKAASAGIASADTTAASPTKVVALSSTAASAPATTPAAAPSADPGTEALASGKPLLEEQIYSVVKSERTRHEKAETLFAMFGKSDRQGQRKVALAVVSQVSDADYELVRKRLLDATLDPRVLSVFMTDTLKRRNAIKLPALLELARRDGHPLCAESRQLLNAYFQKSYGTNWDKWQQAMNAYLAANPN